MATSTLLSAAGALATLFSAALTLRHERKNWRDRFGALVTFGAPRVGNAAFAKMTQRGLRHLLDGGPEKTARVAHCNDIIPHLPPAGLSEGFVHFGRWACRAHYFSTYLHVSLRWNWIKAAYMHLPEHINCKLFRCEQIAALAGTND